jgi:hypothetical protein
MIGCMLISSRIWPTLLGMVTEEKAGAYQKARQINLDAARHGTFAEIGAGQEVARWFFRVGGAAATVAKTISAYDMTISDAIYGPCERYVSRQRLQAILEYEYNLLLQRLDEKCGATTTFFVFAETAAMGSFTHNQPGHAWIGMRFQHQPEARPSDIIVHVRMFESDNVRKQEALGILGVNLIYGGFYHYQEPTVLISLLKDDLVRERFEVDMIRFSGSCFGDVDNRLMSLQLVAQGFTDAAMFDASGDVVQPSEVLFEKPIVIERGSFRPITRPSLDLLERAAAQFAAELGKSTEEPVVVMEMSLRHLYAHLIENGMIIAIKDVNEKNLHIFPKEVLGMIQSGDPAWEGMVPLPGVKLIKERGVFGYRAKT